jgi:peptidoglycan/LPS O-acetylase OafA/YrhL
MTSSIPFSRAAGWLVAALAIGWLLVYNVLRLSGGAPAEVALIAALIGGLIGLIAFGVLIVVIRRHLAHGGLLDQGPPALPSAAQIPERTKELMSATAWVLAALAALAVGMGVFLAASWYQDAPDRAQTTIILAAWNLLIGVWLADEYVHLRRFEGEGLDSVALGCLVTAVLAAVGLSRDMAVAGQIGLIVLGGMGAVLCHLVLWRFTPKRIPWSALVAGIVATLALVLPLIS